MNHVSSIAESYLIVGPGSSGSSVFQDDFCEVVLSGMNVVNVALQEESY